MVKLLFVGCGAALQHLYRLPLKELEGRGWLRVCALVDPAEHRRNTALSWFRHAKAFPDVSAAFQSVGQLDLAIIASPPAFHSTQATFAFERNCHVLCEKPLAHSIVAAEKMVDMAKKYDRVFAVGMVRRFYPAVAAARAWVKDNCDSNPLSFVYREGSVFDWPIASLSQFRRDTGGGGVLIDKGIHSLDMLHYIFGSGRLLRSADDASDRSCVESNAAVELAFPGARGFLQVSWDAPLNNGFHISGPVDELWLPISLIDAVWTRRKASNPPWKKLVAHTSWPNDLAATRPKLFKPVNLFQCIRMQLISVLRSIHLGETPLASGEDGLEVLRLVMAAYEQASPLSQPWLPPTEERATLNSHWRASYAVDNLSQCSANR
jgi:predicted dehydrogenase